jgi:hypothetical protein
MFAVYPHESEIGRGSTRKLLKDVSKLAELRDLGDHTIMITTQVTPESIGYGQASFSRSTVRGTLELYRARGTIITMWPKVASTIVSSVLDNDNKVHVNIFRDIRGKFGLFPFLTRDRATMNAYGFRLTIITGRKVLTIIMGFRDRYDIQEQYVGCEVVEDNDFQETTLPDASEATREAYIASLNEPFDVYGFSFRPDTSSTPYQRRVRVNQLVKNAQSRIIPAFGLDLYVVLPTYVQNSPYLIKHSCVRDPTNGSYLFSKYADFVITLNTSAPASVAIVVANQYNDSLYNSTISHDVLGKFSYIPFIKAPGPAGVIIRIVVVVECQVYKFVTKSFESSNNEFEPCETLDLRHFHIGTLPDASRDTTDAYLKEFCPTRAGLLPFDVVVDDEEAIPPSSLADNLLSGSLALDTPRIATSPVNLSDCIAVLDAVDELARVDDLVEMLLANSRSSSSAAVSSSSAPHDSIVLLDSPSPRADVLDSPPASLPQFTIDAEFTGSFATSFATSFIASTDNTDFSTVDANTIFASSFATAFASSSAKFPSQITNKANTDFASAFAKSFAHAFVVPSAETRKNARSNNRRERS